MQTGMRCFGRAKTNYIIASRTEFVREFVYNKPRL